MQKPLIPLSLGRKHGIVLLRQYSLKVKNQEKTSPKPLNPKQSQGLEVHDVFLNIEDELLASLQKGGGGLFKGQEEEAHQHKEHCSYWKSLLEINQTFPECTTN